MVPSVCHWTVRRVRTPHDLPLRFLSHDCPLDLRKHRLGGRDPASGNGSEVLGAEGAGGGEEGGQVFAQLQRKVGGFRYAVRGFFLGKEGAKFQTENGNRPAEPERKSWVLRRRGRGHIHTGRLRFRGLVNV